MHIFLFIVLLVWLQPLNIHAKSYSCRDSEGQLHFSDNLQGLPEECWGKEKELTLREPDNLNFVPVTPEPEKPGIEYQHSVREVERKQQQKMQQARYLEERASRLADQYQKARQTKRNALRSWNYESRQTIKQADVKIGQIRINKQRLLEEVSAIRLASDKERSIRELLDGITEE